MRKPWRRVCRESIRCWTLSAGGGGGWRSLRFVGFVQLLEGGGWRSLRFGAIAFVQLLDLLTRGVRTVLERGLQRPDVLTCLRLDALATGDKSARAGVRCSVRLCAMMLCGEYVLPCALHRAAVCSRCTVTGSGNTEQSGHGGDDVWCRHSLTLTVSLRLPAVAAAGAGQPVGGGGGRGR